MNTSKKYTLLLILSSLCFACNSSQKSIPSFVSGTYTDDYNIEYEISAEKFLMKPNTSFNIIEWNMEQKYFIAQNDSANEFDAALYSRIDWMIFESMDPYTWGFCLSTYNSPSADSARNVLIADRSKPKTVCNGFPFSRMKPQN